jgi:hypothetical protein
MPYTPGEKLVRWMNVYPKKGAETDVRFQVAVLFATKELADAFAIPGILACVRVTITIGSGLDELEPPSASDPAAAPTFEERWRLR